jgi:hypothetical protein
MQAVILSVFLMLSSCVTSDQQPDALPLNDSFFEQHPDAYSYVMLQSDGGVAYVELRNRGTPSAYAVRNVLPVTSGSNRLFRAALAPLNLDQPVELPFWNGYAELIEGEVIHLVRLPVRGHDWPVDPVSGLIPEAATSERYVSRHNTDYDDLMRLYRLERVGDARLITPQGPFFRRP